jgi:hypothetical protein
VLERLDKGPILCAEGYLFELERRGYVQAGVPSFRRRPTGRTPRAVTRGVGVVFCALATM